MFRMGKRKDKETKKLVKEEVVLTEESKEDLLSMMELKKEREKKRVGEEKAKVEEEIGLEVNEIGEEEKAIDEFEKSIQAKKSVGDGYKTLLKLYNKKRAEAAKANDEASLQLYLKKMDQMMQVSKDVTRGV
ncbi:tetratricopeptide repeat protein (plasmid) [Bacillus megaterium]|nr:tetratricopeptide repeat protein [Priestia megaterium]